MAGELLKFKIFDNHTHTSFSDDSQMDIPEAISSAIERGISGIAFTDHYDFEVPEGVMKFTFDPEKQQEAILKAAFDAGLPCGLPSKSNSDRFKVLRGIEIGMQDDYFEKMKELISSHPFDTVVASLHFVDGTDPYHGSYYIGKECKEAYLHYLETIYEDITLFTDFDILGHFDYIARYAPYHKSSILYSDFGDVIDSILKKLIEEGKTFEINTKTYQPYRGREPELDINILQRFRELGGEFISFGSDAHSTDRIGEFFERYIPIVESVGIKYSVYYQDRKACPIKIQ